MKIIFELDDKDRGEPTNATFSTQGGDTGWVRMEIDGRSFEFDRRDFVMLAAAFDSFDRDRS